MDSQMAYAIYCLLKDARNSARQVEDERHRIGDIDGTGIWSQFGVFLELTLQKHNQHWNKNNENWDPS